MEEQCNISDTNKVKVHPVIKANVLSRAFYTWLFPLFYKGYYKDLTEDDIFPNIPQHDATYLGDRLEREWEKEIKSNDPSLWKAIFRVFAWEMFWFGIWYMIQELFVRLAQPLVLSQLLKYYEPNSPMTSQEAYLYSILIVLSAFLVTISQQNFMLLQFTMGAKIRAAASALVYRKALKLSKSTLAETNVGQMINLISNDVTRFENSVKHIHNLWFAPLETLVVLVLLYFYVGPSGMTGIAFLMLFMVFQMWLGKKVSYFRLNTAIKTDERIRIINEIISGIQVIKMYTWEKPFAKLVELSRGKEMAQIKKSAMIRALTTSFHISAFKFPIYLAVLTYVLTGHILDAQYLYVVTSFFSILRTVVPKRFPLVN